MKAIIWGSCGSLPSPTSSATIRQKIKDAIWASRKLEFASIEAVDASLKHSPTVLTEPIKQTLPAYRLKQALKSISFAMPVRGYAIFLSA